MKHTMWKRSIAFILTFVMLLSLIPLSPHVQAETLTGTDSSGSKDSSASKETAPHRGSAPNLSQLLADIEVLEEPAPINQYYDHGSSAVQYVIPDAYSGAFFIVNVLTDSAGNRHAYAMDMSTPTKYGKATAVPVSIGNPKSNGLPGTDSYIVGMSETGYVSEDMSIEIKSTNPTATLGTAKYHTFKLLGPYAEDGMTYYLNGWPYDDDPSTTKTSYIVSIYPDKNSIPTIALDVRNIGTNDYRVSLTHTGPIETGGSDYYSYYALNTADPNAEEIYYELNTNLSNIAGKQTSFINYYNQTGTATYEQVTSFFFRRREDRVDTSELLNTIRKMADNDLLVWNDRYDSNTYDAFIATVEEAVSLYTRYNGLSVVATTRQTAEAAIADIIREMMNLSAVLQINTEGNEGTDISYFPANMYRWNEDQMNLITKTKEEANKAANSSYVNKGFYFINGKNIVSNPPIFSKWNETGWRESINNVLHDAQRFSISSGLASKKLSASGSPLADSTTVVEPGLWEAEDMYTSDGTTQIKEVYNDVRVPFMYDKETGYYTLDSNTNSVFFEGTPKDGTILKISEKPSVFSLGPGEAFLSEDPDTYVQNKLSTYGLYDGYSAGFQPFVSLTNKEWKGFAASATQYDNRNDIVDGYLIQGIPQSTNTAYYGEMGSPVYGFGMALSIDFELTNDGTMNGQPITFDFGGDDDIWVYIDDELVLDIGGIHGAIHGTIDFSTGTVSVRYNETSRIRDMNGKYGRDESLYELSTDYTQSHGNKLQFGSVMAMKDGSTPVRMYQENLYTGAVNGNAASADKIAAFSAEGTHTLKLFYMDRGRNRTNCYISFNLPRPDTLKVEKNIADTYGYMAQSGMEITDEPISEKLMASLLEETFTLVLKKNSTPVVSDYTVMEGNTPISSGKTDANGTFILKGNQTAHFTNLDLGEGSTYTVEELLPDGSTKWGTPAYTYTYIHADGQTETGIGNSYTFQEAGIDGTETLTISCTNRYAEYTILTPEAQTVVLDYSKPIDIDVVRNAVVTGASELIVREATVVSASMAEDSQDYGTLYATDGKTLRFTPEKMLDKVLSASCSLKLTFEDGGERQVKIPIYLMPATSVYYETDFANSVFSLKTLGGTSAEHPWTTIGTSQDEIQDNCNVGNQLYDFVIEKEKVPSNAFFVDFDGKGLKERYTKQDQYGGVDFDQVTGYMMNGNRTDSTKTTVNTTEETFELYLSTSNDSAWDDRYIQTSDRSGSSKNDTPLLFSPGKNDYVQVRFRLNNCGITGEDHLGLTFSYHRPNDSDVVNDPQTIYVLEKEEADLLAGNYVTVSIPLRDAKNYTAASMIKAFRFTFKNVKYIDDSSKICIDYLYVGPLTDKADSELYENTSLLGQDLDSDASSQALYFDFDNSTEAKMRYTQSQYNRNLIGKASFRNLDTLAASSTANTATEGTWVSSHSTPSGVSINNTAGTLTLPVIGTAGSNADRPYGPYLSTTSTHNSFPWSGSTDHHALDYTPQGETWFYMRFKLTGCALDSHYSSDTLGKKLAYVQFSVLDKNGKGYWLYPNYQFRNDEYITIAIDATAKLNECLQVSSIRSLYFRFTHLKPDGTNTHKIEIDYIYVGPKTVEFENLRTDAYVHDVTKDEALVSAAIRPPQARNVYISFDGSYNDQHRYTYGLYRDTNPDLTASWPQNKSQGVPTITGGSMKITPTASQGTTADGWVDLCTPTNSAPLTKLDYTLTSPNDVLMFRVKFMNATKIFGLNTRIGIGLGWSTGNVSWNQEMARYHDTVDLSEVGEEWVDIKIPLDAYYAISKKITHLYPWFDGVRLGTGGYVLIDYIYIGPEEEFEATKSGNDSAIFISFNNTNWDKARYAGTSYSGVNYDLAANWQPDFYEISNDQNCLKLVPKSGYTSSSGAYYGSVYPKHDTTKPTAALNYKLTGNDHFQMRFKLVNAETASGKTAKAKLVFGPDLYPYTSATSNSWAPADYDANLVTWDLDATDVKNGNWITVDYDLADGNWRGNPMEMIRFLIPVFQHIKFNSGGYALIDYIYVGPMVEARPVSESLFFGFDGQQADLERYASSVYGGYNFDDPNGTYWHYNIASDGTDINVDSVSVDTVGGIMEITATPQELLDDKYPCVYVDTNDRPVEPGQYGGFPLHYRPDKDHIFQIRFKMKDFINTFKWETSYVYICGYPTEQTTDSVALCDHIVIPDEYLTNDTYITLSIPLKDDVEKNPDIGRLRPFFGEIKSAPGKQGKLTIDYIYVGPGELAPDPVYGYDSSYTDDTTLSNGSSYVVEGQGVITDRNNPPAAYTEASFDFTGTGFDIISNTGKDQATIRVEVTKKGGSTPTKTLTVNNKGELELYQIPVVSVQGLEYGEYNVTLWINKAVQTSLAILNRGGTFHFDAVRIYDPMGTSDLTPAEVVKAYRSDKEANAHFKEIRNILLSSTEYDAIVGAGTGALFVDSRYTPEVDVPATDADGNPTGGTVTEKAEGVEINNYYALNVVSYNKVGPKNEVYLAPGQAVAFKLQISTTYAPKSIDVGVKTIREMEPASFVAAVVTKGTDAEGLMSVASRREISVDSATSLYYALDIDSSTFFTEDGNRYCYIVLYNDGYVGATTNVLSLTDLKLTYDQAPEIGLPKDGKTDPEVYPTPGIDGEEPPAKRSVEPYFDFVVDNDTTKAAAVVIKAELETPLLADGLTLGHSLNLASDISINYAAKKADLEGYDNFYLECVIDGKEGSLRIDPTDKGSYYYFTLEGLNAVQMGNTITSTLYMEKDGRVYCSETDIYSIAQYAYAQLSKANSSAKLKTLCAELLRYGSKAQIYKNYRTDNLVDLKMTSEQAALLSDLAGVTFGSNNSVESQLTSPKVTWTGKALILDSKVTIRYVVDIKDANVKAEDLTLRVSYTDYTGNQKEAIIHGAQPYGNTAGRYAIDFDELLAAELRTPVLATLYVGDTQVSDPLTYSADTYGNNKTGALADLCKALFAYADAAKSFFG